jgi:EthD domain-containing protein
MTELIKAVYLARRNPRFERGAFPERWRRHGELALSLAFMDPCIGYFHNDVLADPPRDDDVHTGTLWSADYDGVGVVMFANSIDLEALLTHPDFPILLADEWGAFNEPVANFTVLTHERLHKARIGTAIKFFAFLRAREGIDREAFAERWLAHVALVMSSPELAHLILRYAHCEPMSVGETGESDPSIRERIDIGLGDVAGIAEVGFASRSDMEAYLRHPDREAVRRDLEAFADLDRSVMVATNEVTLKASAALR